jgi:hypothetical protein
MKYIVTNKSVYCGFPVRWFIYTAINLVVQLFTISEYRIIVHCWCRFDALPKRSMVASPFSESMRSLITVHFHRRSEVTLYISRQAFLFLSSGSPLIHRNLPHTLHHIFLSHRLVHTAACCSISLLHSNSCCCTVPSWQLLLCTNSASYMPVFHLPR